MPQFLDKKGENQQQSESIPQNQLRKLADCYHDLAHYSNVPAEKWDEAEEHYKFAIDYYKRLEDLGGATKAEQNFQQMLSQKG